MNSLVRVSASKREGSGVVARARLRSVKLERDEDGPGLSALRAAKMPWRGRRGAGARGRRSSSISGMGDMVWSVLPAERDEADVLREWAGRDRGALVGGGCSWEGGRWGCAMNSHEGAMCISPEGRGEVVDGRWPEYEDGVV